MSRGRENKPHIGIFGRRNNGKSSIINALVGQDVAIVSDIAGTTTDPVKKSIEIFGIGPAIIIDTAGIDDTGNLGELRIKKTNAVMEQIDLAILVIAGNEFGEYEASLTGRFLNQDLPYMIVHNKSDIVQVTDATRERIYASTQKEVLDYAATQPEKYNDALIQVLKETIPPTAYQIRGLLGDLIQKDDIVLLITPIDTEAPDGRMILPQVQVIRDVLDNNCVNVVLKENAVENFLKSTGIIPALAITDSQIFERANKMIPENIPLTSFSIVLARQKGDFEEYLKGTPKISGLREGDRVLILESCSHQVSCEDIGRFKIPSWLTKFTGKELQYDVVAGLDKLPRPMDDYAIVIQCGGCMITHRQLVNRLRHAKDKNIPVTNYGMAIAYMHGIFDRAVRPFIKK